MRLLAACLLRQKGCIECKLAIQSRALFAWRPSYQLSKTFHHFVYKPPFRFVIWWEYNKHNFDETYILRAQKLSTKANYGRSLIYLNSRDFDVTLSIWVWREQMFVGDKEGPAGTDWPGGLASDSCDQHQPIRGLCCDTWPIREWSVRRHDIMMQLDDRYDATRLNCCGNAPIKWVRIAKNESQMTEIDTECNNLRIMIICGSDL